jgi:type I restriction enzyme S subunit
MNAERLIHYYQQIADAPDAVAQLRRFILDLAVRGKLVPQDPNDEPASVLLERIEEEKSQFIQISGMRKDKPLPELKEDEIPYPIAQNWAWTRIRTITSDRGQRIPNSTFSYIDVSAIDKENGCIGQVTILEAEDAPSRARKVVQKGDLIYSCVRPYLLNVAIIHNDINPPPIASTAFAVLNGFGLTLAKYQWIVLRSPFMVAEVESKMRGQAYPAINDSDFALLPFPLPPLAEQKRIVERVDQLMALCDQLEAARANREQLRSQFSAATLARLNQPAEDQAAFRADAGFALQHFATLSATPTQIKALRQTILNLAVRGKLVPQDPNDEPARVLLERIAEKRSTLLK